ncbi:Zn(2)-C6 fungal-type DNA-binding domain-containingprotein [Purpureocillium lilacinum]|uniref:Zn(2)-C6 fungal-type DNA-binding domain-containingprotein n=1 Tax=Purpureocillium lilacinum TaxID=33203 RepID=A0A179F234_PURLI|nr:Zn(2)-C6 fungal-type DNA-binding domain-containingprotein [Purpureocillium lilacinum]
MPQSDLPTTSGRRSRKRARTPSPREEPQEPRPLKRRRHSPQSDCSPSMTVGSPRSAASATSIGQYYGLGDEDALGNLFASYPRSFTTVPHPHGSQGLHEPWWELRFDHEMYLSNDFLSALPRSQRVGIAIPGLKPIRLRPTPRPLKLAREVIGEGKTLTTELARSYERVRQWRERWGWSPLTPYAYESPPPYSPPRVPRSRLSTQSPEASPTPQLAGHSPSQQSSSPTPDPIPNPLIPGDPAPSAEVLFDTLNAFAKAHGFGVVRRNGHSHKGRKIRYSFQCDRFGQPRAAEGAGIRQRRSRKCGCRWMVIAEAKEEGKWLLREHANPEHSQHNHGRSIGPSAHPSHRRLTAAVRATVESTSRRVGIRARDVRAVVQEEHPETVFTQRDIYNARALINCDKLDGYTPTAALIKLFDEKKIPYLVKWTDNNSNRLLGIVWTFPYCLQMWKRFPEVISFDNTYNTNRFKLPLFQATGQTCLGSIYNAAFCLIDNERREGFQFLSESVRQLAARHMIRQPDVVITDFDDAMKAAIDDQFPEAQQQLCIHHIISNVLLKAKQKWVTDHEHDSSASSVHGCGEKTPSAQMHSRLSPKDRRFIHEPAAEDIPHSYQGVVMMWKHVMFAETKEVHEKAWSALCRELMTNGLSCDIFIERTCPLGLRGHVASSGNIATLASVSPLAQNNLYRLVEAIQDMISDQERDFAHASAEDEVLTARRYLGSSSGYLGDLRTTISSKALGLITRQHRIAEKAMPTGKTPFPAPLGKCGEDCSVSVELGIPCCHKIYARMGGGAPFTKWDVHPRWHLREPASRDPYRRILDPKIASSLRGRPKNTAQTVPARLGIGMSNQSIAGTKPTRRATRPKRGVRSTTGARHAASQQASSQATREANPPCQRQTRSQSSVLGTGRTTGVRASGCRTQANIRRPKSKWELLNSDSYGDVLPSIVVRQWI